MLRRDYIIRMIEQFAQALAAIRRRKEKLEWAGADELVDRELGALGIGPAESIARLSENELLAQLLEGGPTAAVREKTMILTALLKEAGDLAVARGRPEEGRALYLKGLHILLNALHLHGPEELPEFAPTVEVFRAALGEEKLPARSEALLMHHYERLGQWSLAEDALFRLAAIDAANPNILKFGAEFYARLLGKDDASLAAGNLPRAEVEQGLAELQKQLRRS